MDSDYDCINGTVSVLEFPCQLTDGYFDVER